MNDVAVIPTELEAKATLPVASVAEANRVLTKAEGLTIQTDEDYVKASDFALECKAAGEKQDTDRITLKQKFLDGCRDIDNYFRGPLKIYEKAFKTVKAAMLAYDEKKRREAEAEQRRIAEEKAKARADEERLAKEAADKIREQQEATEKATAAAASGDREAAIEARRVQLRAEAATHAAVDNVAAAVATTESLHAALSERKPPMRVSGVARKTKWKFRVLDDTKIPRQYLKLDEAKVQAAVDRLKDLAAGTLGDWLHVWDEDDLAIGKKK